MFNLTTHEAASLLGVNRSRIYQLVQNGSLEAEKIGNTWLIDDESVTARRLSKPKPGRPSPCSSSASDIRSYTLMNREHEILSFRYDVAKQAFVYAGEIQDPTRAPLGLLSPRGTTVSLSALSFWWKHRSIPASREGARARLAVLGISQADLIPFSSLGLSLSDQYWVRPADKRNVTWGDVNFFDNDFEEMTALGSWLSGVGLMSPDNTSEGELPKRWTCRNGRRILIKGGSSLNQEPYNEVVATRLFARLLNDHEFVTYQLGQLNGTTTCESECFIASDEEYIPAYYLRQLLKKPNHRSDFQHYIDCCAYVGVENAELALSKMIVCDDILANSDRHWRNFGLIRNVETLEYRIAPLFDSGSSLWHNVPASVLQSGDFTFSTKPFYEDANRQLRLVNDYSWFKIDALEGFAEEAECVLGQSSELSSRASFVREGIQRRIDRIARML